MPRLDYLYRQELMKCEKEQCSDQKKIVPYHNICNFGKYSSWEVSEYMMPAWLRKSTYDH